LPKPYKPPKKKKKKKKKGKEVEPFLELETRRIFIGP